MNLNKRFGFLVCEVARLFGRSVDRPARQQLGLSRAQSRLIAVLAAAQERDEVVTQSVLAEYLDLTPMGVATLCDRMEAADLIRRESHQDDRRANIIRLQPRARKALTATLRFGDALQERALAGLSASERALLMDLLERIHANLSSAKESAA